MKHILSASIFLLLCPVILQGAVSPYIQTRSQTVDSARELMGWTHFVNLFDQEKLYGVTALTLEYTQSFDADAITQTLFGSVLQDTTADGEFLGISGSQYPARNENDLLADYFGLPPDFKSIVKFNPSVRNIILDLNLYLGLDDWLCGLYFRIHAPIVHTWWNLGYCETIKAGGILGYPAGYFNDNPSGVSRGLLLNSFADYVSAGLAPNIGPTVTFESLTFGRMSTSTRSLTRVSELEAAFGWNFLQADTYHLGINIRTLAPCGNRPNGHFLFEPIVGNGHHWGLGVGFTGHWQFWQDDHRIHELGLYIDANLETLFKTNQIRVFDLKNKPLSRYMLTELLGTPVVNLFGNTSSSTTASSTAPNEQFQNILRPLANLTAQTIQSSYFFQADVTLLANYTHCNWSFDLGFNFWTIDCEGIDEGCCVSALNDNTNWALKGDSYVYGFVANNAVGLPAGVTPNEPIPLSATENSATIFAGTNTPFGTPFASSQQRNPNIDNPQFAVVAQTDNSQQILFAPNLPADTGTNVNQTRTSINPTLIADSDQDLDGARTSGLSYKVFVHVSYTGQDIHGWTPYIGIGGKAEFARHLMTDCCAITCDGCTDTNVSEWGVWAKGGFAF